MFLQVSRSAHYRQNHLSSYTFCGDLCPNHMHQCMVRRVQCFRPQDPEMHWVMYLSIYCFQCVLLTKVLSFTVCPLSSPCAVYNMFCRTTCSIIQCVPLHSCTGLKRQYPHKHTNWVNFHHLSWKLNKLINENKLYCSSF